MYGGTCSKGVFAPALVKVNRHAHADRRRWAMTEHPEDDLHPLNFGVVTAIGGALWLDRHMASTVMEAATSS